MYLFVFLIALIPGLLLGAPPRRVASLLPSHTEIVLALGAADVLVGVSDAERASDFPMIPRVGGLVPRWEVLVALAPDLILADGSHQRYDKDFKRFRLPVSYFSATQTTTLEDVFQLIRDVGRGLGREPEARSLVHQLDLRLRELDAAPRAGPPPLALYEIWDQPLQAVGPRSLQGHLLQRAGFANIVPETRNEMPLLSGEWVAAARPAVIFHTGLCSADRIEGRPGWKTVPAVQNGHIYKVDADLFSRAGPRILEALAELARVRALVVTSLHPHPALLATFPQEGKGKRDFPAPLGRPVAELRAPGAAAPSDSLLNVGAAPIIEYLEDGAEPLMGGEGEGPGQLPVVKQ